MHTGVHITPLHDLGQLLTCASQSLKSLSCEMAALHAENDELRQRLGIHEQRKPTMLENYPDNAKAHRPPLDGESDSSSEQPDQLRGPSGTVFGAPNQDMSSPRACGKMQSLKSESSRRTVAHAVASMPTRERGQIMMLTWKFLSDPESSREAYYYSKLLDVVIQISVVLSMLQTLPHPPLDIETFGFVQLLIDLFFLAELTARFWCSPLFSSFVRSAYNINDFIAGVLPLSCRAAQIWFNADLQGGVLKYIVFCAAPVLRELKILRRVEKFHLFLQLFEDIKEAVQLLMMFLVIVVLVFSSLLYAFEPAENIGSIPRAMYLTVVTVTTVGYGDLTPESVAGTVIASLLTLFSILYTAMPIGIIGNAFTQIWKDRDRILIMIKTHDILVQAGYTAEDLPRIFHEYDSTGEGQLDITGFFRMVQDMQVGISEERTVEVFESIDRDGGGSIDEREFVRCIFPHAYHALYTRKDHEAEEQAEEADSQVSTTEEKIERAITKLGAKRRERRQSERSGASSSSLLARERRLLARSISENSSRLPGPGRSISYASDASGRLPEQSWNINDGLDRVPGRSMSDTSGRPERTVMFQNADVREMMQCTSTSGAASGASRISIRTRV
eukprot:TRINITY_DN27739_c0_g1_i1.p1 TRINITY_DN27739_c0_g1~~TRINITY_DN27739_c0_g1_i1.p1  ORF type:complete len:617 (+),score=73.29 TRINITY_DN27739_c0_g1_i1:174-2024(+)